MTESNIFFVDPGSKPSARITQLYRNLELYSDGEPAHNTLFVLGTTLAADPTALLSEQLLLIDPPPDAQEIFQLSGDVAALYTGEINGGDDAGLPSVQTVADGIAHLRIGDHFLDVYTQPSSAVVHFPALGILCGGEFGSDSLLPCIAEGSDGSEELEALRLLASLLKRQHFQLFIPRNGSTSSDRMAVMERLAADVGYLNSLRRVIPQALQQGDAVETIEVMAQALLPKQRSSPACQAVHERNVERLCKGE